MIRRFVLISFLLLLSTLMVQGSSPIDTVKNQRAKFVFQFDGRNTFIKKDQVPITIKGLFIGLKKGRTQYSLGFYGWIRQTYWDKDDSTTIRLRQGIYFASLGFTYFLLQTRRFEVSVPMEIGYGFAQNKAWAYINESEGISTKSINIVPAQIGLSVEWKTTPYFGFSAAIGYRKLLFTQQLANIVPTYDGVYYNYGLKLYLNNIYTGLKSWRADLRKMESLGINHHKFAIYGGIGTSNLRDQLISSFNYQGLAIPFLFNYNYHGNIRQNLSYYYSTSLGSTSVNQDFNYYNGSKKIFESIGGLKLNNVHSYIYNVAYDISAKITKSKLEVYTGAVLNYTFIDKYFPYLGRLDRTKENVISLGLFSAFNYKLSKRDYAELTISTPLINYLDRSLLSSHIELTSYNKTASINEILGLNGKLSYGYNITQRLSLEAAYLFNYYQFKYPRKEQYASQNIFLGLAFNL